MGHAEIHELPERHAFRRAERGPQRGQIDRAKLPRLPRRGMRRPQQVHERLVHRQMLADAGTIERIADDDARASRHARLRAGTNEHRHRHLLHHQPFNERPAEKPRRARDEDAHECRRARDAGAVSDQNRSSRFAATARR